LTRGQHGAASCLTNGLGCVCPHWLAQGHADAMCSAGAMLYHGAGVPQVCAWAVVGCVLTSLWEGAAARCVRACV